MPPALEETFFHLAIWATLHLLLQPSVLSLQKQQMLRRSIWYVPGWSSTKFSGLQLKAIPLVSVDRVNGLSPSCILSLWGGCLAFETFVRATWPAW